MGNTDVLNRVAAGVWTASEPVRIVGMPLSTTMTVLALGDGSVLVHSPVPLTPERRAAVEAIGPVAHLYAPNTFHHLWIGEWASAFPDARVHAPRGLARKRTDLRIDRTHGDRSAFDTTIDEIPIDGFRLEESALIHRPSKTLVVADLVHNVGRPENAWARAYTKTMGFYDRPALSRVIRWTGFDDRAAARRSVDAVLAQPFSLVIVGHGRPIESDARATLEKAYDWLR